MQQKSDAPIACAVARMAVSHINLDSQKMNCIQREELHQLKDLLENARADRPTKEKLLRLTEYDTLLIESAAKVGGFKSCTDLMRQSILSAAEMILEKVYPGSSIKRAPDSNLINYMRDNETLNRGIDK